MKRMLSSQSDTLHWYNLEVEIPSFIYDYSPVVFRVEDAIFPAGMSNEKFSK